MSAETEGIFPIRLQNSRAVERVWGEVWRAEIISTPFWIGTGFMKCVLTTLLEADKSFGSLVVLAASLVMLIEEVFVASTACPSQTCASSANILDFNERISGTASMTMSVPARSERFVERVKRERISSESDWEILDLETSFARSFSAKAIPLSREDWEVSMRVTGTRAARAATRAIPRPFCDEDRLVRGEWRLNGRGWNVPSGLRLRLPDG